MQKTKGGYFILKIGTLFSDHINQYVEFEVKRKDKSGHNVLTSKESIPKYCIYIKIPSLHHSKKKKKAVIGLQKLIPSSRTRSGLSPSPAIQVDRTENTPQKHKASLQS